MELRFASIRRRARAIVHAGLGVAVLVPMLGALGCAGDATVAPPPVTDPQHMYWSLTLDHRAVTMSTVAPYDTIQLTATPRNVEGTPLTGLPAATFTSLDLDRIQVTADGLVQAIGTGTAIPVVATMTVGNLKHADTVLINVTDAAPPPVLARFSIHPDTTDTVTTPTGQWTSLPAVALAADSTPIDGLAVDYASLDPTVAAIDRTSGTFLPVRPGHTAIVATATAYGVTKADTLPVTVGYPVAALIINVTPRHLASGQTVNGFDPADLTVGTGAIIFFFNSTPDSTDITFDDPSNVAQDDRDCAFLPVLCGAGSIAAFAKDPNDDVGFSAVRARSFPVAGTYTYHSTIFGTTGRIVVVDPRTLP